MSRKQTAYRKNRKFGDVYGGRTAPKLEDRIFRRCHSIAAPDANDELPILIQDNPSRDYYFPISAPEAKVALDAIPGHLADGITHIWMRRPSKSRQGRATTPLAEFICGSGVRVVVLYPWSTDRRRLLGRKPPNGRLLKDYRKFGASIRKQRGWWYATFEERDLRRFYIEYLLFHEVGHHVDWYRTHWSKANSKIIEDAADQYAIEWSGTTKLVIDRLVQGSERQAV